MPSRLMSLCSLAPFPEAVTHPQSAHGLSTLPAVLASQNFIFRVELRICPFLELSKFLGRNSFLPWVGRNGGQFYFLDHVESWPGCSSSPGLVSALALQATSGLCSLLRVPLPRLPNEIGNPLLSQWFKVCTMC